MFILKAIKIVEKVQNFLACVFNNLRYLVDSKGNSFLDFFGWTRYNGCMVDMEMIKDALKLVAVFVMMWLAMEIL